MNTTSGYWWLAKEVFGNWSKMITQLPTFAEDTENCIMNIKYVLPKKDKKVKQSVCTTHTTNNTSSSLFTTYNFGTN